MTAHAVAGRYDRAVTIDRCAPCAALWFDADESLAMAPRAVLELLAVLRAAPSSPPGPRPSALPCPRCRARLLATHDRQRATPFMYWRCPSEHGRFIGDADFLREKDFVRPLSPAELARLREQVGSVRCAACGAPLDLAHETACRYCRTPLAVLDPTQVERTLAAIARSDAERAQALAELPLRLAADRAAVDRVFAHLERDGGGDLLPASLAQLLVG